MAKEMVCTNCEQPGKPKTKTEGSILIEIVLWCAFIFPGIAYSILRMTTRHKICRHCGAKNLISQESVRGREIIAKQVP